MTPTRMLFSRGTQTSDRVGAERGLRGHRDRPRSRLRRSLDRGAAHATEMKKTPPERVFNKAAGLGFEPRLLGPEPSVLPLDDPATGCRILPALGFQTVRREE